MLSTGIIHLLGLRVVLARIRLSWVPHHLTLVHARWHHLLHLHIGWHAHRRYHLVVLLRHQMILLETHVLHLCHIWVMHIWHHLSG